MAAEARLSSQTPPPPCQKNLADRGRSARAPCDIYRRTRRAVPMLYGFPRVRCSYARSCPSGRNDTPPPHLPHGRAHVANPARPGSSLSLGAVRPLLSYLLLDFANCLTFLRATRAERIAQQQGSVGALMGQWRFARCFPPVFQRPLLSHAAQAQASSRPAYRRPVLALYRHKKRIHSRRSSTKEMDGAVRQLGSGATPSAPHPACNQRQ